MKRSTERILITHTGSLPGPTILPRCFSPGSPANCGDRGALEARVRSAVAEIVRKQAGVGVDIVNDGEMGKIGYSTYVKDRLSGFGDETTSAPRSAPPTWPSFPNSPSARFWGARRRR